MSVNTGKYRPDKSETSKKRNFGDDYVPKENTAEGRLTQALENIRIDSLYGFHTTTDAKERTGYLINMQPTEIIGEDKGLLSGVDYYFLEEDCTRFKVSMPFYPYFYILCRKKTEQEVSTFLLKKYAGTVVKVEIVAKEDLDMPNHLIGLKQKYLKVSFANLTDLVKVKRDINRAVKASKEREKVNTYYTNLLSDMLNPMKRQEVKKQMGHMENILDIREHDVPHHVRVAIDCEVFVGLWYTVKTRGTEEPPIITRRKDLIEPIDPIVLAYDIETTKLPLKFPDSATDQVMMISYMIDGQGYLITNREIISSDIEDFEYTPKPEFEGLFTVFNEKNEKATLMKFFEHINDLKPHIFVSYHGDGFDWPFVEARATFHKIDMKETIGFAKTRDDFYGSRAAIHLDCLHWVKRDSYLPVGSQGLKAVAKAKLRYDPVELDPEDMCRLAAEQPETLANYSVSDAVATFYLYQKYVQPFIFALCTIIPMNPDEVLRKGSGTLCESLLMVEAFRANIVFPNKQTAELNKLTTDGHVLDVETYVGGHVEALESGVFRADIPYRFKIEPSAVDELIEGVEKALKHSIQEEEKVPLEMVTNFEQVSQEIKDKLLSLKAHPIRQENPVIYHLDVGAMYPNIILTNRLQPSAIVNEAVCAACDFNSPGAVCKREMEWAWRGEYLPASLGEFQRIQQQLETETIKPEDGSAPRPFHELPINEQAALEKKRLSDYCRKAYAKTKVTKVEIRKQTVCQKENSFYVDTVRAFRDRRYEYKGLTKVAKQQVAAAIASGDASEIKSAKSREIIYDSLQLAHKCILNSFYGYVMRKGARWHSMEMGGIVCHTGANIIMRAREIIEKVGRPLELDTDGIWCILPQSFPGNFIVETTHAKKSKLAISYPNAVLNFMVKDQFTNDVYHDLVDPVNMRYEIRNENSIFFEVDGPYRAMVLPAAKEEGKKLKKRYAVFNFDGSLAELKGFEVKRRGELQLIKIFQSSVFESFLKGNTLEECYKSVAKVADYWLDVLYSKGADMPDSDLFELISENKSMSKKLEEYGSQKSTSISTAKRLAEFLGSDMVKDKGLACKFVISMKPQGAPVTERAIPLAIFQSEESLKRHYLRKWLKDSGLQSFDIRDILDWGYYIERLGSTIQKIITIPAAFQGLANPVPRVKYPDWLHKKLLEKNDVKKQRRITDMFGKVETPRAENNQQDLESPTESGPIVDIEDSAGPSSSVFKRPMVTVAKRKRQASEDLDEENLSKNWREVLGPSPSYGKTREEHQAWLQFHKNKWRHQAQQRMLQKRNKRSRTGSDELNRGNRGVSRTTNVSTIHGFINRSHRTLLETPWQIIQIAETNEPGMFRLWAMVDKQLHQIRLKVPRIFYVNTREQRGEPGPNETWKKCAKILPRSRPVYNLYQYTVPEELYEVNGPLLADELSKPEVEGIYETQVSLEFRAILHLGCVCMVDPSSRSRNSDIGDTFSLEQLQFKSIAAQPYLESDVKHIFLYHHWSSNHQRAIWGLLLGPSKRAHIFVQDSVKTNQMPNMGTLYVNERAKATEESTRGNIEAPTEMQFEVRIEISFQAICRAIQAALKTYKNEMKGATILAVQTAMNVAQLISEMPLLNDFPVVNTRVQDSDNLFNTLEWQRIGAATMIGHYLKSERVLKLMAEQCRYFHAPIGNIPADATLFGADLLYARNLKKHNFVLWYSTTERPDLGGSENDDNRLLTDFEESSNSIANYPGTYSSVCVELDIESLAVNTLLQSHHVNDVDGTSSFVAFHAAAQVSLQEMVTGSSTTSTIPSYDETALCSASFKVLRGMVSSWLKDVTLHKNVYADCQLMDFYRWLRSPSALLYDPALRRTLHNYMKKLFIQLVAEFMRLGSIIVFANFNKIIICTKKRTVDAALGHINYVVASIRNKELFHSINITFENCWLYLVWLDLPNHAGVLGKLPKDMEDPDEDEDEDEDDTPQIMMNWNLMEILPNEAMCREHFRTIIAGYISAIYRHITDNEPECQTPKRRRRDSTISQTQTAPLGLGALQNSAEFAKKLIAGEMSQKLFQIVQKIHKRLPEKVITLEENPNLDLDGAESKRIGPALEMIKAICKILSLDKELTDEVYDLKKNMLRLISVGSFSDKAEWTDPCISFVLPEVICKTCNHTRDIDLCKDSSVSVIDGIYLWNCPMCETSYENAEIEFALIDILYRRTMGYVLQDLQCRKCLQIKRENANELCSCSGEFNTTVKRQEMIQCARIMKSISKKCRMLLLDDAITNTRLISDSTADS